MMEEYEREEEKWKQLVEELKRQKEKIDKIENQFDVIVKVRALGGRFVSFVSLSL